MDKFHADYLSHKTLSSVERPQSLSFTRIPHHALVLFHSLNDFFPNMTARDFFYLYSTKLGEMVSIGSQPV
jgi:hypothetical protein